MNNVITFPQPESLPDYSLLTSLSVVLRALRDSLTPKTNGYLNYLSHPYSSMLAKALDPVTGDLREPFRDEWKRAAASTVGEISESLEQVTVALSLLGGSAPYCGLLERACEHGSACLWEEPVTRESVIEPIRSSALKVLNPPDPAQATHLYNRVISESAWWLKHPTAGAVRAPGHRLRGLTGEIQYGSNYIDLKLATELCAETVLVWCDLAIDEDDLPAAPLKIQFAETLSKSVSLDGRRPYEQGYPRDHNGMMTFGTQGFSARDFAEIMFKEFSLLRMQQTGFICTNPAMLPATEARDEE